MELDFGNLGAELCVVGRCDFTTGLGAMTYAACELLSRAYPTCLRPTEPWLRQEAVITLPNGRRMPVCQDYTPIKLFLFCDVLWNGNADRNYLLVDDPAPPGVLRIAWIVFDSDELPRVWVDILNHRFDLVLTTSPHLIDTVARSGVTTPAGSLPIALDLAGALAKPAPRRSGRKIRFGSVAAFHPRKGIEVLTEAFLTAFAGRDDAELVLHSNLAFADTFERVTALVEEFGAHNVTLTHEQLDAAAKDRLIRSIDVLANCSRGEAYSVGPREALASGCALVLSDVGGHRDLAGLPGVFSVAPTLCVPARYPEIDGMVFGRQQAVTVPAVTAALQQAHAFASSPAFGQTVPVRRAAAGQWSFDGLELAFAALLNEQLAQFRRPQSILPQVVLPPAAREVVRRTLGPRAGRLTHARHVVQLAHDGGFFSIFNSFFSNMVWEQREGRCHAILPDWDVGRMLAGHGAQPVRSFCYGQPEDGNIWCHLFEPLFGYSDAEMNDRTVLYHRAVPPRNRHNEWREPTITFINAYRLYTSPSFAAWRRQYGAVFEAHIRLRPDLQADIDRFSQRYLDGRFVIAAHVRHPSHTVEQPGAVIAREDVYLRRIEAELARRGLRADCWTVFLATDQDRVVERFKSAFGDRVAYLSDVRRTRAAEDQAFERLPEAEKGQDGHQLQHLVSADRANWSVDMAREVIRDAWLMARANVLLHVVSNVSTAVAYLNPAVEMLFCSPDAAD